MTFEDGPTDPDDPRMGELASWKPTARGTGEYYGGYDFVGSSMRNGESKLSLAKLMGSTIDSPQATTPHRGRHDEFRPLDERGRAS